MSEFAEQLSFDDISEEEPSAPPVAFTFTVVADNSGEVMVFETPPEVIPSRKPTQTDVMYACRELVSALEAQRIVSAIKQVIDASNNTQSVNLASALQERGLHTH